MDTQDKDLQERFEQLPDSVVAVMSDPTMSDLVQGLCKKYLVPLNQYEIVEAAVTLTLLGENRVRDFEDTLRDTIDTRDEDIEELAKEIYIAIFQPILGELELFHETLGRTVSSLDHAAITDTSHLLQGNKGGYSPATPVAGGAPRITLNFPGAGSMGDGPVPLIPKATSMSDVPTVSNYVNKVPVITSKPVPAATAPAPIVPPAAGFPVPPSYNQPTPPAPKPAPKVPSILESQLAGQSAVPKEEVHLSPKKIEGDPYREPLQ